MWHSSSFFFSTRLVIELIAKRPFIDHLTASHCDFKNLVFNVLFVYPYAITGTWMYSLIVTSEAGSCVTISRVWRQPLFSSISSINLSLSSMLKFRSPDLQLLTAIFHTLTIPSVLPVIRKSPTACTPFLGLNSQNWMPEFLWILNCPKNLWQSYFGIFFITWS